MPFKHREFFFYFVSTLNLGTGYYLLPEGDDLRMESLDLKDYRRRNQQ